MICHAATLPRRRTLQLPVAQRKAPAAPRRLPIGDSHFWTLTSQVRLQYGRTGHDGCPGQGIWVDCRGRSGVTEGGRRQKEGERQLGGVNRKLCDIW